MLWLFEVEPVSPGFSPEQRICAKKQLASSRRHNRDNQWYDVPAEDSEEKKEYKSKLV